MHNLQTGSLCKHAFHVSKHNTFSTHTGTMFADQLCASMCVWSVSLTLAPFPRSARRRRTKEWARACLDRLRDVGAESLSSIVAHLTEPKKSEHYKGVVVGVEDLQNGEQKRKWEATAGASEPPDKVCRLVSAKEFSCMHAWCYHLGKSVLAYKLVNSCLVCRFRRSPGYVSKMLRAPPYAKEPPTKRHRQMPKWAEMHARYCQRVHAYPVHPPIPPKVHLQLCLGISSELHWRFGVL